MDRKKHSEKVTNEAIERIGENRTLLNNMLRRKAMDRSYSKKKISFFMMPLKDRRQK